MGTALNNTAARVVLKRNFIVSSSETVLGSDLEYATSKRLLPSAFHDWMQRSLQKRPSSVFPQRYALSLSNSVKVSSSTSHFFKIEKMVLVPNPPRASCGKTRAASSEFWVSPAASCEDIHEPAFP